MHRTNVSISDSRYPVLAHNKKFNWFDIITQLCYYCYRQNIDDEYDFRYAEYLLQNR